MQSNNNIFERDCSWIKLHERICNGNILEIYTIKCSNVI